MLNHTNSPLFISKSGEMVWLKISLPQPVKYFLFITMLKMCSNVSFCWKFNKYWKIVFWLKNAKTVGIYCHCSFWFVDGCKVFLKS